MTATRIALVPAEDGSWKRPDCECTYHFWDGVPVSRAAHYVLPRESLLHGVIEPHVHLCEAHAPKEAK